MKLFRREFDCVSNSKQVTTLSISLSPVTINEDAGVTFATVDSLLARDSSTVMSGEVDALNDYGTCFDVVQGGNEDIELDYNDLPIEISLSSFDYYNPVEGLDFTYSIS